MNKLNVNAKLPVLLYLSLFYSPSLFSSLVFLKNCLKRICSYIASSFLNSPSIDCCNSYHRELIILYSNNCISAHTSLLLYINIPHFSPLNHGLLAQFLSTHLQTRKPGQKTCKPTQDKVLVIEGKKSSHLHLSTFHFPRLANVNSISFPFYGLPGDWGRVLSMSLWRGLNLLV